MTHFCAARNSFSMLSSPRINFLSPTLEVTRLGAPTRNLTAPGLTADDVSLSGIVLYDADGHPIPVQSASNPGGDPHGNHPATYLIDGDGETKWLDTSFNGESILRLQLAASLLTNGRQSSSAIRRSKCFTMRSATA